MNSEQADVAIAFTRGPVSFSVEDDGSIAARRGGGGVVSALSEVARAALWVCAARSDGDRRVARKAASGRLDKSGWTDSPVRMLDIPPERFDRAVNGIANSTLWFLHHLLYQTATVPSFDASWRENWEAYRDYNAAFARALSEDAVRGGKVAVQDFHLGLVSRMLRGWRTDLRICHFSHTPWAPPEYFRLLPDDVAHELLDGMLGADHAGFLSPRWADAFLSCCEQILGASIDRAARTVSWAGRITRVGVHPLGIDAAFLRRRAGEPDVETRYGELSELVGDRRVVLRIDRTELSKNIVRGLSAYREFLRNRPEWRGRVVHLVFAYPSRQDLAEYRDYTAGVQRTAAEIQDEFRTEEWNPLVISVEDDFARSLAALRLADVLVVNPIRDGMNLIAKEGVVLSDRGTALVLSREAGAADELSDGAFIINPYDVSATADAIAEALDLSDADRRARCRRLVGHAVALPPERWFAAQLAALD